MAGDKKSVKIGESLYQKGIENFHLLFVCDQRIEILKILILTKLVLKMI